MSTAEVNVDQRDRATATCMVPASNTTEIQVEAQLLANGTLTGPGVESVNGTGTEQKASGAIGTLWILATLLAASIEPVIVKFGYAANCSPWQLLCLKSIVGAIIIWPLTRQRTWVGLRGLLQIFPVAALLLCTGTLMLLSLQYLQASMLITIVAVTPAAVALINQALGRDILGPKFWAGFIMCAGGIYLTTGDIGKLHLLGVGLAFAAVISSTTYRVLLERVTRIHKPAVVSTYIFLLNGLCVLPFVPTHAANLPPNILASGVWLGIAAAVANVSFLYAISILGSTRVSIITMLERPIVICIAALLLKEQLTPLQIIGIVIVIAGVQLAKVKRKPV
jgi:drug/metabolite transporter (DMT)-like permease